MFVSVLRKKKKPKQTTLKQGKNCEIQKYMCAYEKIITDFTENSFKIDYLNDYLMDKTAELLGQYSQNYLHCPK